MSHTDDRTVTRWLYEMFFEASFGASGDAAAEPDGAVLRRELAEIHRRAVQRDRARIRRRRRWLGGLGAGVAIAGATAGAAAWLRSDAPADPRPVSCWDTVSPDANRYATMTLDPPLEACTEAWLAGYVHGSPLPEQITACVNASEAVVVLPGGPESCGTLGFALLDERGPHPERDDLAALDELIESRLVAGCSDEAETVAVVTEALRDERLRDWTYEFVAEFGAPLRECGFVTFDVARHVVLIAAGPRP